MNFEISLYSLVLQNIQMRCELGGGDVTKCSDKLLVQYFNILVHQVEIVSILSMQKIVTACLVQTKQNQYEEILIK